MDGHRCGAATRHTDKLRVALALIAKPATVANSSSPCGVEVL